VQGADSIGAIAVAPSDPNIIYAGTGDLVTGGGINTGDGIYKSTDAGKTWTHIGLEGTQHINAIVVDPKDPNLVLASTQGDLRHPGPDRGVYRSTDGGQNWTQVLHPDDSTGARDMAWAFDDPSVVFATTIADVGGGGGFGGGGGRGAAAGPNRTALYKSADEGLTWTKVTGGTVPELTGRTGVAVAMHTRGQRVFWIGNGLYRSDDGGATWTQMAANDGRIRGSGYICAVYVDSQNPDIVYTMATSFYRSTDGGQTFESWKGAPGGDDNHVLWIDPTDGQRMLLGADQGGVVSLDGGRTWSSWYNQATDQVYRITTDTRYPYWVLASQQDSGSTMIRSRSDFGRITALDWWPVPASEFGSIASDPLNPDIIYAQGYGPSGSSGSVTKISQSTGQWE
ncbi:MAG: WD40/YVTN/BNR-like repeat-containing protein, partial [Streptosporangiaceae bacterium]